MVLSRDEDRGECPCRRHHTCGTSDMKPIADPCKYCLGVCELQASAALKGRNGLWQRLKIVDALTEENLAMPSISPGRSRNTELLSAALPPQLTTSPFRDGSMCSAGTKAFDAA
jgi:hypothetical protein